MNYRIGVILLLCFLVSCSSDVTSEPQEIKVGVIAPLTGVLADIGTLMQEGFDFAVEEINTAGGIDGKKLVLIYEDTKCIDNKAVISALIKLKDIDEVAGVVGPYCGGPNFVSGKFSMDNELFIVSPGDNLGKVGDYKVNTRYLLSAEAKVIAEYAISQDLKNIGVLYFNNEWGQGYLEGLKQYAEAHGAKIVRSEAYTYENLDVRTPLLKIKEAGADVVAIIDGTGGDLYKQAHEIKLDLPLISEWEISKTFLKEDFDPVNLEGVVYAFPIRSETSVYDRFENKHGKEPNLIHLDSYDSVMLMSKALEECSPSYTAQCMTDYVTSLQDYPGAGGDMSFDKETWSFEKDFELMHIKDGKRIALASN